MLRLCWTKVRELIRVSALVSASVMGTVLFLDLLFYYRIW